MELFLAGVNKRAADASLSGRFVNETARVSFTDTARSANTSNRSIFPVLTALVGLLKVTLIASSFLAGA